MTEADKANEGREENIIDAMFRAQFGTREQSDFVEAHIKEYFVRWPSYKDKLNHLEWYHLFLDFSDKIQPIISDLRDQLSKEREKVKQLQDHIAIVDKSIQSAGELYEKNLKKEREDNKNLSSLLNGLQNKFIKEREMRKEAVTILRHYFGHGYIHGMGYEGRNQIESLIAKATELDKK